MFVCLFVFPLYLPASPSGHPFHKARVEDHEDDVEGVEDQQDDGLVVREFTVPRKTDEATDGHGVEEGVTHQWPPIQRQDLAKQINK